jgi:zinc transport system ATP-binding protein
VSETESGTSFGEATDLLFCRSLEVGYRGQAILPPITLGFGRAQFWAVVGRNGSGKSTWLRTLLGLLPPVRGSIEHAEPGLRIAYLPQRHGTDELYPLLAREVVALGALRGWGFLRPRLSTAKERAERALEEVGARDLGEQLFRELSEGQKQRVLFARLAASEARLAVLDEPTSAMDLVAEREAFELLDALRKNRNMTVVVVSHYLRAVREFADRAIMLDRDSASVIIGTPAFVLEHSAFLARYGEVEASDSAVSRGHALTQGDGNA